MVKHIITLEKFGFAPTRSKVWMEGGTTEVESDQGRERGQTSPQPGCSRWMDNL